MAKSEDGVSYRGDNKPEGRHGSCSTGCGVSHHMEQVHERQAEAGFLTEFDLHLFREGTHSRLYEKLGAHPCPEGTRFALWAPNARRVSVLGKFNGWSPDAHPLQRSNESGVWEGMVDGVRPGEAYSFHLVSSHQGFEAERRDPFAFRLENPPGKKCFVWDLGFDWHDADWLHRRRTADLLHEPFSIYRMDGAAWRRVPEEGNRPLTYSELAPLLIDYLAEMGFSHVQLRPVMERPSRPSREITGYFAPSGRQGAPQDFMHLVDRLHQHGIGVILEWVGSHFPSGDDGLAYFDGAQAYEDTIWPVSYPGDGYGFDFARPEVRSFLLSSACFWLDVYHADGLHLGNLGTILYLDSGRRRGEWVPNAHGGRERLEGIAFLRELNEQAYGQYPGIQMLAGEASGWPLVTRPTYAGGLGFGFQWDEQPIRQMLEYLNHDPFFRKFHHNLPIERSSHAFAENNVLPLPDEGTVQAGAAILPRIAGDGWQKFAGLRALLGWQYLQPAKKSVWMGVEFAQWNPWNPEGSLDWHLLAGEAHRGMRQWVRDLNLFYRSERALHESDSHPEGFEWVNTSDSEQSVLSWLRRDTGRREAILVVCNFTPVVRKNYRVGVRRGGCWYERLNSDATCYGGSGQGNLGKVLASPIGSDGLSHTLTLTLPPLSIIVFKWQPPEH